MTETTVLLPVYNGDKFLREAIQSILDQSYTDFEFLIINDGSTDNSAKIIESFDDTRITFINNPCNQGIVKILNFGLETAKGGLIARMDADDVCNQYRLEKQVKFLQANPQIDVLGCQLNFIDEHSSITGHQTYALNHDAIKIDSLFRCPLPHSGVIFRKNKFIENNLFYDVNYKHTEDYELWQRALACLNFANSDEKLLNYRITPHQVSTQHSLYQKKKTLDIRLNYVKALGLHESEQNNQFIFLNFLDYNLDVSEQSGFEILLHIIDTVISTNQENKIFNEALFNELLTTRLDRLVRIYASKKNKIYSRYQTHQLFNLSTLRLLDRLKILGKQWIF
jgi:glycosyltransferase involved in cell wall biosynthesis